VLIALYTGEIITAIITFATLIIVCTTPWVVIMTIGFFARRGFYRPDDLQVFNRGQRGGSYWFSGGYNWRGLAAWIPAALVGVFFVNIPEQFEGPLRNTFGGQLEGVDVSLAVVIILAAVLYIAFELLFPEPREVYGPEGPRLFRAAEDKPPPPIEQVR
jgi:purine-cytosine permease-like protein